MAPTDTALRDLCARTLARSFTDDPYVNAVFDGNEGLKRSWLERGFGLATEWALSSGGSLKTLQLVSDAPATDDPTGKAALAIFPPGCNPTIRFALARSALRKFPFLEIPWRVIARVAWTQFLLSKRHPREPHWYVLVIGADPAFQGKGLGSILLAPAIEQADRDGKVIYLESTNPRNLAFYLRNGFRPAGELVLPGGRYPRFHLLARLPHTPYNPNLKIVLPPDPSDSPTSSDRVLRATRQGGAFFGSEILLTSLMIVETALRARAGERPGFIDTLFLILLAYDTYHWKKALTRWRATALQTPHRQLVVMAVFFGAVLVWQIATIVPLVTPP